MTRPVHYVCGDCGGSGTRIVPRAAIHRGEIGTAHVGEDCRRCDGTGWIPPKRDDPRPADEDD